MQEHDFSALTVNRKYIVDQVVADNLSFDSVNVYEIMREPILTQHQGTNIRLDINITNRLKI